ncbi:hypothetical protein B0H10DRAFT_2234861 [Mycena sp. CBHHK59/15]|nr:hypothetical protein B0H10DRAFT_2234861 [Mycena sp. CBHHK59/15]
MSGNAALFGSSIPPFKDMGSGAHALRVNASADPRQGGAFPVADTDLNQYTPVLASGSPMQPGHYIMASIRQVHGQTLRHLHTYETLDPVITTRTISRSGTNTAGTPRKDAIRSDVCSRDLKCRVTGQNAPPGSRGYNFSGLEVAHIFPLGSAGKFHEAFTWGAHEQPLYIPLRIPRSPRVKDIDIIQNALVMRGDVHSQFDDYQFGFETSRDPVTGRLALPRLRLFEKDGAPSINRNQSHYLHTVTVQGIADVNATLLTQHFLTALLWHVAGNGLKAKDNAITPDALSASSLVTILQGHTRN